MSFDDPMWNEFRPLWSDLRVAGNQILVAGGYGLFLKQRWLSGNRTERIVIPLEDWQVGAPRVTNDIDLVIGLELLGSPYAQEAIVKALDQNGFTVVEKNPRWQFHKQLDQYHRILVDLHAELPEPENQKLRLDKIRIKHKPSLGDKGVHGRQNRQAAGCELHPFKFTLDAIEILVPNPVTWSLMKLISTRDRRLKSQDTSQDEEYRTFHGEQAKKHAQDLARIVAMTTRDERDRTPDVIAEVRRGVCFADAVEACEQLFRRDDVWGMQVCAPMWLDSDFKMIRETLTGWFQ